MVEFTTPALGIIELVTREGQAVILLQDVETFQVDVTT